jgi:hypothetical protein
MRNAEEKSLSQAIPPARRYQLYPGTIVSEVLAKRSNPDVICDQEGSFKRKMDVSAMMMPHETP